MNPPTTRWKDDPAPSLERLPEDACGSPDCGCDFLPRRDFLRTVGLGAAGALVLGQSAVAGPFNAEDFAQLVPADKKLRPEWVQSLFARHADRLPGR